MLSALFENFVLLWVLFENRKETRVCSKSWGVPKIKRKNENAKWNIWKMFVREFLYKTNKEKYVMFEGATGQLLLKTRLYYMRKEKRKRYIPCHEKTNTYYAEKKMLNDIYDLFYMPAAHPKTKMRKQRNIVRDVVVHYYKTWERRNATRWWACYMQFVFVHVYLKNESKTVCLLRDMTRTHVYMFIFYNAKTAKRTSVLVLFEKRCFVCLKRTTVRSRMRAT